MSGLTTARETRLRNGIVLGFWIALLALSFFAPSTSRMFQWPWYLVWRIVLFVPPCLLAILLLRQEGIPRFGGSIDLGLGLVAVGAILSAVLGSHPWQSSVFAAVSLAACTVSYLLLDVVAGRLQGSASDRTFARFELLLGLSCAVFAAVSLGQWFLAGASGRNEFPFGHSTYVAGAAVLALPVLGGLARTRRPVHPGWALAVIIDGAVIVSTGSRGGVAGAVAIVLLVTFRSWRRSHHRLRNGVLLSAAGVAVAAVFVWSNPRLREFVQQGEWSALAAESNRQRSAMLAAGWMLGAEKPVLGHGPGTVPYEYPKVRGALSGGVDNVLQLHSTPVHVWAEQGAVGLLGGLLVIAGFLPFAFRGLAADNDRDLRRRTGSALLALLGYGVIALTDFQLDVPFIAVGVAAILVFGAGGEPRGTKQRLRLPGMRWALFILLISIIGWNLVATTRDALARARLDRGLTALESGDAATCLDELAGAIEAAPWEVFYRNQLAMYWLHEMGLREGDDELAARQAAVAALEASLTVEPAQEFPHFNLGWLLFSEDPDRAVAEFLAAARLVPDKGGVYFGLGLAYRERGDDERAARAFALEWLNDPIAMAAPVWDNPEFALLIPEVVNLLDEHVSVLRSRAASSGDGQTTLDYVLALARWWTKAEPGAEQLTALTTGERRRLFRALLSDQPPATPATATTSGEARWEHLLAIWRSSNAPAELRRRAPAMGLDPDDVVALQRWLAAVPPGPDPFRAPLVGDPALFPVVRNQRPGYGVLMRNQDGMILTDVYVRQVNRLARDFVPFLFPPKGWLDSRLLLERLDAVAAGNEP